MKTVTLRQAEVRRKGDITSSFGIWREKWASVSFMIYACHGKIKGWNRDKKKLGLGLICFDSQFFSALTDGRVSSLA